MIRIVAHEIMHSLQYQKSGRVSFLSNYARDLLGGYSNIPVEREAFGVEGKAQRDLHQNGLGCGCQ